MVIVAWLVERAIAWIEAVRRYLEPEIVTMEDLGIERVRIGSDW